MKPIDAVAAAKTLYSGATESQTSNAPSLPDTDRRRLVMVTLWQRMREIFGNVWELNYGSADSKSLETWAIGLAEYSVDQIKRGVEQCKRWDKPFPPNLGQFAKLCLTHAPGPKHEHKQIAPPRTASVKDRELARQARIASSPKSRKASADDVESFSDSWRILGMAKRHGAL